jgi:hypothetical protein
LSDRAAGKVKFIIFLVTWAKLLGDDAQPGQGESDDPDGTRWGVAALPLLQPAIQPVS